MAKVDHTGQNQSAASFPYPLVFSLSWKDT
jgi:hypothetical protein